jgi:hypothetical protein
LADPINDFYTDDAYILDRGVLLIIVTPYSWRVYGGLMVSPMYCIENIENI